MLSGCSSSLNLTKKKPKYSPRIVKLGQRVPKGGGRYKVGNPYQVAGVWYTPREDRNYDKRGIASWYGEEFHGRLTANGEVFDMNASLYTYKCSHLKKGLGALEGYNEIITMYDTGILDLDHENDLLLMQIIAEYLFLNKPEFMLIQKNIPTLLV